MIFIKCTAQSLVKVLSIFSLRDNVTLDTSQRSPHISEQKGDPGGSDYPPVGGNPSDGGGEVCVGVFWGWLFFFFFLITLTCSLLGCFQALLLPVTILEAVD